jgi:lysophospholipase L1-like esterase
VWVGPIWGVANSPYHKADARVAELSQFLAQSVSPCTYVDSTRFAKPGEWPTTDGQHLTVNGYKSWGQDIADSVGRLKSRFASAH